jgi:hypothetical protein
VSEAVVSASTGASRVVVSVAVSSVDVLLPPQATNARAKPHTIRNANSFFIVFTGFYLAANIAVKADSRAAGNKKLLF